MQDYPQLLMPIPASLVPLAGKLDVRSFALVAEFTQVRSHRLEIAVDGALERWRKSRAQRRRSRAQGRKSSAQRRKSPAAPTPSARPLLRIECSALSGASPGFPNTKKGSAGFPQGVPRSVPESYRLRVDPTGITINAAEEWGVLRGLATLTQLIAGAGNDSELDGVQIEDAPRFPWRGLLLDVARHFLSPEAILRTLDGMALVKLNVLHLHLTDDQAFRFPSLAFPELSSRQAYSRSDLTRVIDHAAGLGIRVIPELDMPGHVTSWLAARPEWGSRPVMSSRKFGVHPACLDPTRESVYQAIDVLLGELAALFPDSCVHLGGDEVQPGWWQEDARIIEFCRAHQLDDPRGDAAPLQGYFFARVAAMARQHGKRVVGWDEVLAHDLPADTIVQCWRGVTARDSACRRGCDAVVSAPYYLDLNYPADVHYQFDPDADEPALLALEDGLLCDPRFDHIAEGMAWTRQWREQIAATEAKGEATGSVAGGLEPGRVLGAEACLWGELTDEASLDVRLWSRLPALAERFWSPAEVPMVPLARRLRHCQTVALPSVGIDLEVIQRSRLDAIGVPAAWWPLVDLLEPVKWYGRLLGEGALAARLTGREMPQARPYDADSALDQVVDILPPESPLSVELQRLCAGSANAADRELGRLAEDWRKLSALPDCPAELQPVAEQVGLLGCLVDDVLAGRLDGSGALRELKEAGKPQGEFLLAPVLPLTLWIANRGNP